MKKVGTPIAAGIGGGSREGGGGRAGGAGRTGARNRGFLSSLMKKFGTPIAAGIGSASENVGLRIVGMPLDRRSGVRLGRAVWTFVTTAPMTLPAESSARSPAR